MAQAALQSVLRHLHTLAEARARRDLSDQELVGRFAAMREEAAFTLLVQRHGPMVLALCRRILGNVHDAEDAFQATFLVLARRAGSIRERGSLASWLYGVAQRVAVRAKAQAACRRGHERRAAAMAHPEAVPAVDWEELRLVLDEEVGDLPEKYRAPLVLCHLEGKTQAQAALELGLARSTLGERLERAREALRGRLARRGIGLTGGTLAAVLTQKVGAAAVPALLALATVRAALAPLGRAAAGAASVHVLHLAEGVLKTMAIHKVKVLGAVLVLVAALGAGTASFGFASQAAGGGAGAPADPKQSKATTAGRPAPGLGATRAERERLADLLLKLAQQLKEEEPNVEAIRRQAVRAQQQLAGQAEQLRQRLEEQIRAVNDQRQRKALEEIARALRDLKSTVAGDAARKRAVEDFQRAFDKLRSQLGQRGTAESLLKQLGVELEFGLGSGTAAPKKAESGEGGPKLPPRSGGGSFGSGGGTGSFPGTKVAPGEAGSPPAGSGVGVVEEVTPEGLIRFGLGKDDGVEAGQTRQVLRMPPNGAMYLGELRVIAVGPRSAVGTAVRPRFERPIQKGDLVVPAGRDLSATPAGEYLRSLRPH
jgi:RNA polymerase sigma factor (sigma-70 family)